MDENISVVDGETLPPEAQTALNNLGQILGAAKLLKAADELNRLAENGFGEVYITFHDHHVVMLRVTNSYR